MKTTARFLLVLALTAPAAWAASIMDYGAAGNGSSDDTSAVNSAFTAAASSGDWLTGQGKTYAVSGNINVPAGLKLRDVIFKQTSPGSTDRITLSGSSANGIHFENVTVNRNGTGSSGYVNGAAGMWFNACNDLILDNCEVYGNDKGNGIVLQSCQRFVLNRPYIHDIRYVHSDETTLQINGLFFISCSLGSVRQPNISNLGRTATGADHDRLSRGVGLSGCNSVTIDNPTITLCEDGVDIAGSGCNTNISLIGGTISHVYSNGVLFADSAIGCAATGVAVEHAGFNGFAVLGPGSAHVNMTRDITLTGCMARNTGSQKQGTAGDIHGFKIARDGSGDAAAFPKNVQLTGCMAIADEGTSDFTVSGTSNIFTATNLRLTLSPGTRVTLATTSALPTGLSTSTDYWLIPIADTNTFKLASSYANALAGTAVTISSGGSGTQSMTIQSSMYDGFYSDVVPVDPSAAVFARDCRAVGFTNKAYNNVPVPLAIANRGSTQSISGSTWTDVLPTNDVYDALSATDSSTPAPDFIVPFAGVWRLEANLEFESSSSGYRSLRFMVDTGSGYNSTNTGATVSGQSTTAPITLNGAWEGPLKKGDKVKVQVYQTATGAQNLSIYRLAFRLVLDTGI